MEWDWFKVVKHGSRISCLKIVKDLHSMTADLQVILLAKKAI